MNRYHVSLWRHDQNQGSLPDVRLELRTNVPLSADQSIALAMSAAQCHFVRRAQVEFDDLRDVAVDVMLWGDQYISRNYHY